MFKCVCNTLAVGWGRARERESKQASMLMIIIMARTSWRRGRQTAWSEEEGGKKTGVGIGYFCQRNASNNEPCAIASVHSAACGTPSYLGTYWRPLPELPPSLPPHHPFCKFSYHTPTPLIPNNNPSSISS